MNVLIEPDAAWPRRDRAIVRSLTETLNPASLSDDEIATEIREIRIWLDQNPASSEQANLPAQALGSLLDFRLAEWQAQPPCLTLDVARIVGTSSASNDSKRSMG